MEEEIERETLELLMPPLLLQPLVENAIAHGIAKLPAGGRIRLEAHRDAETLSISVENSFDPEAPAMRRNGMGLANVRQRLVARYGNRSRFQVKTEGNCFHVDLVLPAERKDVDA
jgi:LytS/YehU family sensor histidine kinase